MNTNEMATAACRAAMAQTDALSWQAAHPFFKPTRRGAQIHIGHLAHLHRAARIAFCNVADPEADYRTIVEHASQIAARMLRPLRLPKVQP